MRCKKTVPRAPRRRARTFIVLDRQPAVESRAVGGPDRGGFRKSGDDASRFAVHSASPSRVPLHRARDKSQDSGSCRSLPQVRHWSAPQPQSRSTMFTPLCSVEILAVTGDDAATFLQGQLCSNVAALAPGRWQWSAWLDARGRVRYFFALLHPQPARWLLWLPLGGAEAMRRDLARFILRARVELDRPAGWALQQGSDPAGSMPAPNELRAAGPGWLLKLPAGPGLLGPSPGASVDFDPAALNSWRLAAIRNGLPLLAPELGGEFMAVALGLDRLGAIDYAKGCYPGQEIVARLHFRGGNKRQLWHVALDDTLPSPGAPLHDSPGRSAGRILYAAAVDGRRAEGLALIGPDPVAAGLRTAQGAAVHPLERFLTPPEIVQNPDLDA